ncbi:MAG: alpha/beta hydrolase [Ruminococcus sp.]|nr:alpha/beta hydrolase [Ruminococcus sp.]
MKKVLKTTGKIILVLLIVIALALLACFIYQKTAQKKDRELLEKDGFSNLVSAGDYDMNINIYGDGKHQVIAMPGSGDAQFTAGMRLFSEYLDDDISLVVVSRPGYGLSGETDQEVTTEYIVESTRTALQNAGIEAPYILMPHSMSGIYATYWESTYLDEVSGVIWIDTVNEADMELLDEGGLEPPAVVTFLCKAGVFRALGDLFGSNQESGYGKYNQDAAALYNVNPTAFSKSGISEIRNISANMQTAWDSIKSNDIPKVYISTHFTSVDDANEYLVFAYGEEDEEEAKQRFEYYQSDEQVEYRRKRSEYIEKLGNCQEINIPGSHFIYEQKPEECAKVIEDFIENLNG